MTAQVIAGQLTGTLFNTDAAAALALEVQSQQDTAITITSTAKSARDMALNARTASRVLQSLPTEVCQSTYFTRVLTQVLMHMSEA